ncbi:TPR repeat protein [Vibrio maritimus]|uniref:TPR repeat protein n=1 Tax=Vibrio maritimus TaxID=990268 RepID=A0A090RPI5_9VIBR|nr:TPR repeat protein [Vibrio maritimus]
MKLRPLVLAGIVVASMSQVALATDTQQQTVTATTTQNQAESTEQRIQKLSYTAQNQNESAERRVDALHELSQYPNQNALVAVTRSLKDANADVREAAIVGAKPYQFEYRWKLVSPLLSDPEQSVQVAAVVSLIPDFSTMTESQQQAINKNYLMAIEYLSKQSGKRSQLLLADVYRWHKEWDKAEALYQTLLADPSLSTQASLSLSDNYRAQSQDQKALDVLNTAIEQNAKSGQLQYAKALTLVRMDEKAQAAVAIEKATILAPGNSYYWYLNGVLQEPLDVEKATDSFEKAYLISGAPEQLYAVCDIYVRHDHPKADVCLEELGNVAPPYVIEQLKAQN